MNSKRPLAELSGRLRGAAADAGAKVVPASIRDPAGRRISHVTLDFDNFVELIRHVRPRVVYLAETSFDAHELALDELAPDGEEIDGEEDVLPAVIADDRFEELVERWSEREGKPCIFHGQFALDGVVHITIQSEDWYDEFLLEVEELALGITAEQIEGGLTIEAEAEETDDGASKAEELLRHPKFGEAGSSRGKREYLARRMFRDLDEEQIKLLVDEAETAMRLKSGPNA